MQTNEEIIKEMQEIAKQMVIDDIEENPDSENEGFDCDCCGQYDQFCFRSNCGRRGRGVNTEHGNLFTYTVGTVFLHLLFPGLDLGKCFRVSV